MFEVLLDSVYSKMSFLQACPAVKAFSETISSSYVAAFNAGYVWRLSTFSAAGSSLKNLYTQESMFVSTANQLFPVFWSVGRNVSLVSQNNCPVLKGNSTNVWTSQGNVGLSDPDWQIFFRPLQPQMDFFFFSSAQTLWREWQRLVTRLHKCVSAWCISVLSAGGKVDPPLQANTSYPHSVMRVAEQLHLSDCCCCCCCWQQHSHPASPLRRCTCASRKTRCVWQNEWLRVPLPIHGGTGVPTPGPAPEDPQVRAVQEPRRAVVAQRSQALLPLQGLHLREMHPHHRAAARHGGAGGAAQAAGQRKSGEPHPGVSQSAAWHWHTRVRWGKPRSPAEDRGAGAEVEQHGAGAGRRTNMHR